MVQRKALALLINALLRSFWANDACGLSQFLLEQHHWAKDDAQAFEEVTDKDFHHLNVFRFARIYPRINASISSAFTGTPRVISSQPLAVTSASSSIRMPMFQNSLGTPLAGRT